MHIAYRLNRRYKSKINVKNKVEKLDRKIWIEIDKI